ncbi:NAD-dependent epimerase/dehydratase [Novosphingobium nitrogenifigens DSM 19370]|uniref:NAD-dependent epimerase/dehydratase n=1 Tax=Novosphingobium nitrogenifigens DSM 19370 TaxID=983920 RepID=F1Z7R3_9SPHN|nr:complex I NDUFA9 subunit family protein [Novosphingobium nitrogenifigens]EGD59361.1 NAD-dependent epimerase/dehydratase [Novosphingobium nitrogenifigens DSM 19370]
MTIGRKRDLEGKVIALIGGTGFFGTHLAQELLDRGARLRVASRHPSEGFNVKPLGNLGSVQIVAVDVTKPHTLEVVFTGVDAVVNLVGAFSGDLDAIQGRGAGQVAAIAKARGAKAFVHISAIGADAGSSVAYARTKAEGETAVLAAFPEAVILRPSVLFGVDDTFLNMFGGLMKLPVLPVFAPESQLQPLDVDDAAEAIGNVLAKPEAFAGKTYELAGPEALTVLELNRRIARATGRSPLFWALSDGMAGLLAALPFTPISCDQYALLKNGSAASGSLPGIRDLGVHPRPLELFLERWLVRYRKHGRFGARARSVA